MEQQNNSGPSFSSLLEKFKTAYDLPQTDKSLTEISKKAFYFDVIESIIKNDITLAGQNISPTSETAQALLALKDRRFDQYILDHPNKIYEKAYYFYVLEGMMRARLGVDNREFKDNYDVDYAINAIKNGTFGSYIRETRLNYDPKFFNPNKI